MTTNKAPEPVSAGGLETEESAELARVVERLIMEWYGYEIGMSEIVDLVARCRQDLSGSPGGAMPEMVERLARERLQTRL